MPFSEQVEQVRILVREHYEARSADPRHGMGFWGRIHSYLFYYAPDIALKITPDGTVLEEVRQVAPQKARLTVNGRDMALVLPPVERTETK